MRIVVAPDSFKGSLSAVEVADCMGQAIYHVFPSAEVVKVPIADGGEGTVQAMVSACGGEIFYQKVIGPLGQEVEAHWGLLSDGKTAVIEMAAASGLLLVPPSQLNPLITSTYGTGQLISAALESGCQRLIIGIGGSATNDGGSGMAQALGAKLLDAHGNHIPRGGAGLKHLAHIDISQMDPRLAKADVRVACDVTNPLYGPNGAANIFGPQKGATPQMIEVLDDAMKNYASKLQEHLGFSDADLPGAGAAGGLGAGLVAFAGARLESGIDLLADILTLDRLIGSADLVLTGEGRFDAQTARGKVVLGVSQRAQLVGVPTIVLAGSLEEGAGELCGRGISAVFSICTGPMSLTESMTRAKELLVGATIQALYAIQSGMNLQRMGEKN